MPIRKEGGQRSCSLRWPFFYYGKTGIVRFYGARSSRYDLRWRGLFVLRFYRHSLFGTPFGDSIFLLVKKDGGERHAKGLRSRPLESGFFIRGLGGETCLPDYVFARVQLTRFRPVRGVLRTASTDSCLLHRLRQKIVGITVTMAPQHAEARG